jgi:hypothetical protein
MKIVSVIVKSIGVISLFSVFVALNTLYFVENYSINIFHVFYNYQLIMQCFVIFPQYSGYLFLITINKTPAAVNR